MVVNEARDVQGLAKALMNLGDMEMLRAMGEAARDTALQYTWEDNVRQNLRICRRILQGKQQA
jgi:hypothetical protein